MSFAAPIKQAVAMMFGLDERHLNGELKEEKLPGIDKSPRELFQTLGTEWGRHLVHPDAWLHVAGIWLGQLRDAHRAMGAQFPGAVFADVRFENEAVWIRQRGGVIIHLHRHDAPVVNDHISERGMEVMSGDYLVTNNGTLDELHQRLDDVMRLAYLAGETTASGCDVCADCKGCGGIHDEQWL